MEGRGEEFPPSLITGLFFLWHRGWKNIGWVPHGSTWCQFHQASPDTLGLMALVVSALWQLQSDPPLTGQAPDRVYVPSLPSPFSTEPPSPLSHPTIATLVPKASKCTGVRLTAVWDLKVREERGKRRSIVLGSSSNPRRPVCWISDVTFSLFF